MDDPHQLARFVAAQRDSYADALAELKRGRKASHWMWWTFPQLAGLGRSPTARHYAIASAAEARAYLAHPLLGARLDEALAVATTAAEPAEAVFGESDAIKLRSSLTLFAAVADDPAPFRAGLDRFFNGEPEPATLALLSYRRREPGPASSAFPGGWRPGTARLTGAHRGHSLRSVPLAREHDRTDRRGALLKACPPGVLTPDQDRP